MIRLPQRLAIVLGLCGLFCVAQSAGVWLDVPFVRQEKDGCGAASMAMVIHYWRIARQNRGSASQELSDEAATADAAAIQRVLYSPRNHGILASDMENYFQQHGFRTFTFRGTWDDLKLHLGKGRPLIVALKPMPAESALHYVVVVGLDVSRNVVLVNDAAQRKLLKQERAKFEKEWSAVDRWTLLAVPGSQK